MVICTLDRVEKFALADNGFLVLQAMEALSGQVGFICYDLSLA